VKIIYLHQYFLTPEMSGATRSYEMARRLASAGHEVHMITTDQRRGGRARSWRESTESGIRVHWARVPYSNEMGFAARLGAFFSFAVMATALAARLKGDVILATSTPLTIAAPALVVSAWRRIPFVFEVRDMWPDVPIAIGAIRNPLVVWLARWLELTAYRRAAHVVALAPGMRDDIIAKGIPAAKVSVVPNGCDLDVFSEDPGTASPRDEFSWLGTRKLVLFAGTLGLVNGVDYLVRLAAHTAKAEPEIRFVVIGGGREWNRVHDLAAQMGVLDRSFFMFEPLPKRELVQWLHAADLIVALFTGPPAVWKDAVQNKFFDALAAGKPIASNFDGWQSRIAVEAGVGLTLDSSDIEAASRQVIMTLGNAEWLGAVPEKARHLAEGRFKRTNLANQMLEILVTASRQNRCGL
jgi:glycosyltransferase involved in cell wall biosynthesis